MDLSVEERVHELFGRLLNRFSKQGVLPVNVKREMYKEIEYNIAYFWNEFLRNPDDFIFHMYESWLTLEDRTGTYLGELKGYELMYNYYRTKENNICRN